MLAKLGRGGGDAMLSGYFREDYSLFARFPYTDRVIIINPLIRIQLTQSDLYQVKPALRLTRDNIGPYHIGAKKIFKD